MAQKGTLRISILAMELPMIFLLAVIGCHKRPSLQQALLHHSGILKDLNAIRAGDDVWISWTMPQGTLNKLTKRGFVAIQLCRPVVANGPCANTGKPIPLGAAGSIAEMLPKELASGNPRVLVYTLELTSPQGGSPVAFDEVGTVAGEAPPPLRGLTAEVHSNGVLLRWSAVEEPRESADMVVQVFRKLLTKPGSERAPKTPLHSLSKDSEDATFETQMDEGRFLEVAARSGELYQYFVQRVARVRVGSQTLDLTGGL